MKLSKLFGDAELPYPPEYGEIEITKIVTDSRQACEGCLFLCIKGRHTDALGYADDAIKAGAGVIAAECVRDACVGGAAAYIVLENTRRAAALLYNAWYGQPTKKMKIVGVTGTNGKTSVCALLCQIFTCAGYRCGVLGTVGCRSAEGRPLSLACGDATANLTTPDPEALYGALAQMAEDRTDFVFMEVSSHALALHKVDAIAFDMALFTNLTQDHLDFHGEMEQYFQAKMRLFSLCRRAVLCTDDEAGARLHRACTCPSVTCSRQTGDYAVSETRLCGLEGVTYRAQTPRGELTVSLPIPGHFAVINSLMAVAVAMEYGISADVICDALRQCRGVEGRMERVDCTPYAAFSILIDYAHTPDALEQMLKSVRDACSERQRLILLFGCGGDRDRSKRKEMAAVASRLADLVIVTSDNSRSEDPEQILAEIVRGLDREKPYAVIVDRREAIETAVAEARAGDVLVLAGKGHERYEIRREGRIPFDERSIVKQALQRRAASGEER